METTFNPVPCYSYVALKGGNQLPASCCPPASSEAEVSLPAGGVHSWFSAALPGVCTSTRVLVDPSKSSFYINHKIEPLLYVRLVPCSGMDQSSNHRQLPISLFKILLSSKGIESISPSGIMLIPNSAPWKFCPFRISCIAS